MNLLIKFGYNNEISFVALLNEPSQKKFEREVRDCLHVLVGKEKYQSYMGPFEDIEIFKSNFKIFGGDLIVLHSLARKILNQKPKAPTSQQNSDTLKGYKSGPSEVKSTDNAPNTNHTPVSVGVDLGKEEKGIVKALESAVRTAGITAPKSQNEYDPKAFLGEGGRLEGKASCFICSTTLTMQRVHEYGTWAASNYMRHVKKHFDVAQSSAQGSPHTSPRGSPRTGPTKRRRGDNSCSRKIDNFFRPQAQSDDGAGPSDGNTGHRKRNRKTVTSSDEEDFQ